MRYTKKYKSLSLVADAYWPRRTAKILGVLFVLFLLATFLPWTQTVTGIGQVTTLRPEQRPQNLNTAIAGSIKKWYVREGEFVQKGDTIMFLSEVKEKFIDPQLLERTESQIEAKKATIKSYEQKIEALDNQLVALNEAMLLKMEQARNKIEQSRLKVTSDSMAVQAEILNQSVAKEQLERQEKLYEQGLKSLTELEARRMKFQEAQAKLVSAQNKLLSSRNELINAQLQLNAVKNEYLDKIGKAESDKYASVSALFTAEGELVKLQNEYMNLSLRAGFYYVTAPQDGFITKTISAGIGEVVKEGETVATIVPADYELAAEIYVRPVDLPLIHIGEHVRLQFDGWPAIVFSGWPTVSYGTYGSRVVGIDNNISPNGKYRILVAPDPNDPDWPHALRPGSGVYSWALLNDVPVWYEIWRQLNGFPPSYYQGNGDSPKKPMEVEKEK